MQLGIIQHVDEGELEAAAQERFQAVLIIAIEEVANDNGDAGTAGAKGVFAQTAGEGGGAVGPRLLEEVEEQEALGAAAHRSEPGAEPVAEDRGADAVIISEADIAQRGGHAASIFQLRRAAEIHRARRIQQEVDVQVFLFHKEL